MMELKRARAPIGTTMTSSVLQLCLVCACVVLLHGGETAAATVLSAAEASTICAEICAPTAVVEECIEKCELVLLTDGPVATSSERLEEFQPEADDYEEAAGWKSSEVTNNKRAPSSFIRIGRQLRRTYFGKRDPLSDYIGTIKTPRIVKEGHRSHFSSKLMLNDAAKRASSFVRIGRQPAEGNNQKRYSSFVRIGRNIYPSVDSEQENTVSAYDSKRTAPEFIRFGKDLSMEGQMKDEAGGATEKRLSSFVRIGRSSPK